jgi:hypothetical protein
MAAVLNELGADSPADLVVGAPPPAVGTDFEKTVEQLRRTRDAYTVRNVKNGRRRSISGEWARELVAANAGGSLTRVDAEYLTAPSKS